MKSTYSLSLDIFGLSRQLPMSLFTVKSAAIHKDRLTPIVIILHVPNSPKHSESGWNRYMLIAKAMRFSRTWNGNSKQANTTSAGILYGKKQKP